MEGLFFLIPVLVNARSPVVMMIASGNKNVLVNNAGRNENILIINKPKGTGEANILITGKATEKSILTIPSETGFNQKSGGGWLK